MHAPPPRTYSDEEFTKLEARLLAAHGQAMEDGALGTVLDAAATEVLFRLTGRQRLDRAGEVDVHLRRPRRPSPLPRRRDHRPYPLGPGDEPRGAVWAAGAHGADF